MWFNTDSGSSIEVEEDLRALIELCDLLGLPKWDTLRGRECRVVYQPEGDRKLQAVVFITRVRGLYFKAGHDASKNQIWLLLDQDGEGVGAGWNRYWKICGWLHNGTPKWRLQITYAKSGYDSERSHKFSFFLGS